MILKTYARLWVPDLDATLPLLESLVGRPADLRFAFGDVELAAIGDFLVVAGSPEALAPHREATGPVVVTDLVALQDVVVAAGGAIVAPAAESATGSFLYARHADGSLVEYVQWRPELVARIVDGAGRDRGAQPTPGSAAPARARAVPPSTPTAGATASYPGTNSPPTSVASDGPNSEPGV